MNYIYLGLFSICILIVSSLLAKRSKKGRKAFIVLSSVYSIVYLFWRAFFTLPTDSVINFFFAFLLFMAEAIGHIQSLIFKVLFWEDYKEPPASLDSFLELPTVDILISTYNEPEELLKLTAIGCLNIDYPKEKVNIFLCDDGRRQKVKELADQLGIGYITRTDNKHAKAGNINNALTQTKGEFILLLDADMVPHPRILKRILPQFTDPKVGFVQTPQVFYNADPFQYNLYMENFIPNEQDFFMRKIQAGKARYNAVMHVGTNAIFRRSALLEIGGVPYGSITEDMLTGMLLQNKGYKSVFIKDTLALGLSPDKFSDLVKQRDRWARGGIQIAKNWRIWRLPGLSFMQKLLYTDSIVYWFYGLRKMVFILTPSLVTFLGVSVLNVEPLKLVAFFLPGYLASVIQFRSLFKSDRTMAWAHIYDTVLAPFASWAVIKELFLPDTKFVVTPKTREEDKGGLNVKLAHPHIIVLLTNLIAAGFILNHMFRTDQIRYDLYTINLFWIIYNSLGLIVAVLVTIERPRIRHKERFATDLGAEICCETEIGCCQEGRILDISEGGLRVGFAKPVSPQIGEVIKVKSEDLGNLATKVTWKKSNEIGLQFLNPEAVIAKIITIMFRDEAKYRGTIDSKYDNFYEILFYELKRPLPKHLPHNNHYKKPN